MKRSKVAIVIGHSENHPGAKNYLDEYEYQFNTRIATKLATKLLDFHLNSLMISRENDETYRGFCSEVDEAIRDNDIKVTMHLHFNSYTESAKGCEVLMLETDSKLDNLIGHKIADTLHEQYGFKLRGDRGLKYLTKRKRGYPMLKAVKDAGAVGVIVEPTFGHVRHNESKMIFENEDKYVDVLVDSILHVMSLEEMKDE